MLLGEGVRLLGQDLGAHVVGAAVRERPRDIRALAEDRPALSGLLEPARLLAGRHQDKLRQRRRAFVVGVAVDPGGLVAAFDHATAHELGDRRGAALEHARERREPHRHRANLAAAEPANGRRGELDHGLAVEVGRGSAEHDDKPLRADLLARASADKDALEPLATELAEVIKRAQLTAGAAIQLGEGSREGRLAEDRHDEDVGLDVPRLLGGNAYLHGRPPRTWWRAIWAARAAV